jgi:hypothetical protein
VTRVAIPESVSALDENKCKQLADETRVLIEHLARRIEYAERRRDGIMLRGAAFVAAAFALWAWASASRMPPPFCISTFITGVALLVLGLTIWIVHAHHNYYFYPWRPRTGTWKWFYTFALDEPAFQASLRDKDKASAVFDDNWTRFSREQVQGILDPKENATQNLRQVFVLHVNELYKNRFLKDLSRVHNWGLCGVILVGVLSTLVAAAFWCSRGHGPLTSLCERGPVSFESSWRGTRLIRQSATGGNEVQVLANIRITNHGSQLVRFSHIIVRDRTHLNVPVFIESMQPSPPAAEPQLTTEVAAVIWVPEATREDIAALELGG